jgi:MoaA/NifB/PqqE/SkfB family radical SAM enzyme
MILSPGLFFPTVEDAQALFLRTVTNIEIEIGAFCNRRCSFCPNSFIDRISTSALMENALFHSIVSQLGCIDYAGTIRFHRYNEPLADRDYVLRRLREVRDLAPKASVLIQTNGDYLDRDFLDALYEAGCRRIFCTAYLKEGAPYDHDSAIGTIEGRARRLGLPVAWTVQQPGIQVEAKIAYRDMDFTMRARNFACGASDRGGSLATPSTVTRETPCFRPFDELQIEHDGTLMPCCELRSDFPGHRDHTLGTLKPGDSLVEAWSSAPYIAWRKALFSYEPKQAPCANCANPSLSDTPALRATVAHYRRQIGLDQPRL